MFIKLGQVASTRSDLLPAPVIAELTQLQTAVEPSDPDEIREVVEEELGRPVEEVFATFDWTPLAAASIGQVHRATLVSGEVRRGQGPAPARRRHREPRHPGDAQPRPVRAAPHVDRPAHGRRHARARVHRRGERRARLHDRGPGRRADPQRPRQRRRHPHPGGPPRALHPPAARARRGLGRPGVGPGRARREPGLARGARRAAAALLPRADPRGRGVPRRPAPGQHPAGRRRHA